MRNDFKYSQHKRYIFFLLGGVLLHWSWGVVRNTEVRNVTSKHERTPRRRDRYCRWIRSPSQRPMGREGEGRGKGEISRLTRSQPIARNLPIIVSTEIHIHNQKCVINGCRPHALSNDTGNLPFPQLSRVTFVAVLHLPFLHIAKKFQCTSGGGKNCYFVGIAGASGYEVKTTRMML